MSNLSPDLVALYFSLQYNGKNSNASKKEKIFIHNINMWKEKEWGPLGDL